MKAALALALVAATGGAAWAHKPSDAHLQLAVQGDRITGTLAVALRDLDGALDLDANGDGNITWAEALAAGQRIEAYARARLHVAAESEPCAIGFGAAKLVDFSDGAYWAMPLSASCPSAPDTLVVTYALLFDLDAQHRGIVSVATAKGSQTIVVRDARPLAIALCRDTAWTGAALGAGQPWREPWLLVLLACLFVPAVRARRGGLWRPATDPRDVLRRSGALYAAFALASTAMLLAATAELVYLPPQAIQTAIMAALAIVAAANLLRLGDGRRDLAFELGLIHGLACAAQLHDAGVAAIYGYALGLALVEAAFVAGLASAVYAIRRTFAYRALLLVGSIATVAVALIWTCQRWLA
ncbi:MAG TPA: HupE/UreJ family protein [Kofleriaceae bacterium]|nr:HupE/UreJ family protein [Kofleriaceae bacterium]